MDKYDILLDLLEHPESYSPDRIKDLLNDPESRDIYNLICKTESALHSKRAIDSTDIDLDWEKFEADNPRPRKIQRWRGNRAAIIGAIAMSSLAAVATCITIAVAVYDNKHTDVAMDSITIKTVSTAKPTTIVTQSMDSVTKSDSYIMFEDERLDSILSTIASHFNLKIIFNNPNTPSLHLYYRFDPTLSIDEVIDQLNTFEQISIRTDEETLIVE